jgi:hypothetical protein
METVVVIALSAVLMIATAQLYVVYGQSILSQKSSINVMLGGNSVVGVARLAGLQASRVVATHVFSGISYNSGTTTVLFELPAIDSSGAIIANTYDYVGVYASSTDAYSVTDAAPGSARVSGSKRLTDVLSALSFTYDTTAFSSVTNVTIDATTTSIVSGRTAQTHIQQHIYLRNI